MCWLNQMHLNLIQTRNTQTVAQMKDDKNFYGKIFMAKIWATIGMEQSAVIQHRVQRLSFTEGMLCAEVIRNVCTIGRPQNGMDPLRLTRPLGS